MLIKPGSGEEQRVLAAALAEAEPDQADRLTAANEPPEPLSTKPKPCSPPRYCAYEPLQNQVEKVNVDFFARYADMKTAEPPVDYEKERFVVSP